MSYYEFPEEFRQLVAERNKKHQRLAYADVPLGLRIQVEDPGILFLHYRYAAAPDEETDLTKVGRVTVGLGKFSRRVMLLRINLSTADPAEVKDEIRRAVDRAFEALLEKGEQKGPRMNYDLASRGTRQVADKIGT